jgi:nucleotide-binding universal stress UspA family protein
VKILLAVDDSPCSTAALKWLIRMSWPPATRVLALAVANVPAAASAELPGGAAPEPPRPHDLRPHEEFVAAVEEELRRAGLRTEGRVVRGDPRVAIVDAARAERVDLVVMGSHGRTGLARLLLGSVASHVVSHSPCSVVVVKIPREIA